MSDPILDIRGLAKDFVLHNQSGAQIGVFENLSLTVHPGECVVFSGPSGVGKSTLMRAIYGNYLVSSGSILVRHEDAIVDIANITPRVLTTVRRRTMGYVSQFLRVIPRVPTLNLVMEPMLAQDTAETEARAQSERLLAELNLPRGHWDLPPATFSGGEQQRVNVARGFGPHYPLLLLDEPTASLDARNKEIVIGLIRQRLKEGAAVIGIFHDQDVRDALAPRLFDMGDFQVSA